MPGVVLAVPDRPQAAPHVLTAATRLMEMTGAARLIIRIPPEATILPSEEVLTREREARIRRDEQHRIDAIKAIYDSWRTTAAHSSGYSTEWFEVEGLADQLIEDWGRRADFIVIRRPTQREAEPERRAVHAGLFRTARPVLIVPGDAYPVPFGRRIAIAWRDDNRTARAVLAGLRCAARAEEIHVIAGVRDTSLSPSVPDIFHEHGLPVKLHVVPITGRQAFGEAFLKLVHRLGADMLVMGAFVHHPVRNLILGGMTRYILVHSDLPVLMRH
jgi:nucleotide-binding universal stress UspA family protein